MGGGGGEEWEELGKERGEGRGAVGRVRKRGELFFCVCVIE